MANVSGIAGATTESIIHIIYCDVDFAKPEHWADLWQTHPSMCKQIQRKINRALLDAIAVAQSGEPITDLQCLWERRTDK